MESEGKKDEPTCHSSTMLVRHLSLFSPIPQTHHFSFTVTTAVSIQPYISAYGQFTKQAPVTWSGSIQHIPGPVCWSKQCLPSEGKALLKKPGCPCQGTSTNSHQWHLPILFLTLKNPLNHSALPSYLILTYGIGLARELSP